MTATKRLLNTTESAAYLGIGRRTIQERVAARELACVKIGKSIRFDVADLDAFIESRKVKARGWKGAGR
jgi:excisionase family DNA binding protein